MWKFQIGTTISEDWLINMPCHKYNCHYWKNETYEKYDLFERHSDTQPTARNLKKEMRLKLQPYFYGIHLLILWRQPCTKFCGILGRFYKVTKSLIRRKWRHNSKYTKHFTPDFLCIFCWFYGENASFKVLWCF